MVVLAHAGAAACLNDGDALELPFAHDEPAPLCSEDTFRRRIGLAAGEPGGASPYSIDEVARLSGLAASHCRTLALFDVIAPGGDPIAYQDLATARQAARLMGEGVRLASVIMAAADLARQGRRVSQVRLVRAPWGEIVQRFDTGIARLDGQFALVLEEEGRSAEASFAAARGCEDRGELEEAERWYRSAERLDKANPVAPFNLGNLLAAQARIPEAMIAYQRALARDAAFAEAQFNLARLHDEIGQVPEALAGYRATIAAHPSYAQAIYNGARLLTRTGGFREAAALWDRFIALAPDDPDIGHARRLALLCRMEAR